MPNGLIRFKVSCEPDAFLVINARRGVGNVIRTQDYIPGTTLRGALAAINGQMPNPMDWGVFQNRIRFPDLTPEGAVPIPLSAFTCKRAAGFSGAIAGHGAYDRLLFPRRLVRCRCKSDVKPMRGWMIGNQSYSSPSIERLATMHTAINPRTRTADPKHFYLEESVSCKQGFHGELIVSEEHAGHTLILLEQARLEGLRIGHGRSKGLGRTQLYFELSAEDESPLLPERLRSMQAKLRTLPGRGRDAAFTITLRSRTILLDDYLRFRSRVRIEDLLEATQPNPDFEVLLRGFRLEASFTETEQVFGWNVATGLPKSPDVAVAAGACFWLMRRGQLLTDSDVEILAAGLETLEKLGIGERRPEGFGRIAFCDPFHYGADSAVSKEGDDANRQNYIFH